MRFLVVINYRYTQNYIIRNVYYYNEIFIVKTIGSNEFLFNVFIKIN